MRKLLDIQSRELEVIVMGSVALRRGGSAIARLAEIVHAFAQPFGFFTASDAFRQQRPLAHDIVESPMPEHTGWCIGVLDN